MDLIGLYGQASYFLGGPFLIGQFGISLQADSTRPRHWDWCTAFLWPQRTLNAQDFRNSEAFWQGQPAH